jgi:hypothetical protein
VTITQQLTTEDAVDKYVELSLVLGKKSLKDQYRSDAEDMSDFKLGNELDKLQEQVDDARHEPTMYNYLVGEERTRNNF